MFPEAFSDDEVAKCTCGQVGSVCDRCLVSVLLREGSAIDAKAAEADIPEAKINTFHAFCFIFLVKRFNFLNDESDYYVLLWSNFYHIMC